MRSKPVLAYSLLFFFSGATGLVYELLWVRLLYQSFGSTIQSVTTVVAAYMGGLGLGAWLFGARADRHTRPTALYGRLEILIGLFGLASPLVLSLAQRVYLAVASAMPIGSGVSIALRFGLAGVVLLVPTTLMGGTLPVLTRAFTATDRDRLRISLGRLYGINTLGAVLGTALAGFVLIERVGIRASLLGTAVASLCIGFLALRLAVPIAMEPTGPSAEHAADRRPSLGLYRTALVLLGLTAFVSLADEIAWTRVLVMIVGGSTYAFTLVLLCFLLGIGIGSAFVARRSIRFRETAASAAYAQGLTAAGAALVLVLLSVLPAYILWVFQVPGLHALGRLTLMGGAVAAVVLVPAVGMGMTFPLLTDLIAAPGEARGADVGRAYLINTLGSIAGAALTGFVLVAVLGSDLTLRSAISVNGVAALLLAVLAARDVREHSAEHERLRVRIVGGGALACAGLVAAIATPRWTARLLDLGPTIYGRSAMTPAERQGFLNHAGARPLEFIEGRNTTVSVWEASAGRTLRVTGKVDASDYGDMDTQIMLGLAPIAVRAHPRSALAIGFGSGVTTAMLAAAPDMERVRVVELEPAVLKLAPWFRRVNGSVLERPNVRALADDARSALQLSSEQFDVIVSEPSNPWVAGVATLYTPEFFRIVQRRLTEGGVFCQWVQLYQLPLPVVAGIVRNVREVFPHVAVWSAGDYDLMVLGSTKPLAPDTGWVTTLLSGSGTLAAAARGYLLFDRPSDFFDRQVLGEAGVERLVARASLTHTDDHPQLEFVAARRFLDDRGTGPILDSLAAIERPVEVADALDPVRLARALSARLGDPAATGVLLAARKAQPANPAWSVALAAIGLVEGDSALADSVFPRVVAGRDDPRVLLLSGLIATGRGQTAQAKALLGRALGAGADSGRVFAAFARLHARDSLWSAAIQDLRSSLRSIHDTFRSPFPRDLFSPVLTDLARSGPPASVDSVLAEMALVRPGWVRLYELRLAVALRQGECDTAGDLFLVVRQFGLHRDDDRELIRRCRAGQG